MARFVFKAGILALLAMAAFYGALYWAAQVGTQKALPKVEAALASLGVEAREIRMDSLAVGLFGSVEWRGMSGRFEASETSLLTRRAGVEFSVDVVRFKPVSLLSGRLQVSVEGLQARSVYVQQSGPGQRIGGFESAVPVFEVEAPFEWRDLRQSIRDEYAAWQPFWREGIAPRRFRFEGVLAFSMEGRRIELDCHAEARDDGYGLKARRSGVVELAEAFDGRLTDAEIDVVARHPLQGPDMLRLRDYAIAKSTAAAARDATVPEDAYRHLLWSYVLTLRFGERLAEEITDAHEIGAEGNTEADHRMDYHNNALGRRFAREGLREGELLERAKRDPEVIRAPL